MYYAQVALKAVRANRDAKKNVPFSQTLAWWCQGRLKSRWGNNPYIL